MTGPISASPEVRECKPRTRASKPKTKTGCITCRARRVKCDEGKPACQRCVKFGRECDGYSLPRMSLRQRTSLNAGQTRRVDQNSLQSHSGNWTRMEPPLLPMPIQSAPSFEDSQEHASFLHFQQHTIFTISGTYDTTLWDYIIIQACRNETPLRRLMISVGALTKAQTLRNSHSASAHADELFDYACRQYGRALQEMQKYVQKTEESKSIVTRKVLIASLLVYCFENMNGSIKAAVTHMRNALELMQNVFGEDTRRFRVLSTNPRTQMLEYDLVSAMVRIDSGILSRFQDVETGETVPQILKRKNVVCVPSPNCGSSILQVNLGRENLKLSSPFSDVGEARRALEYIQFWGLPHLMKEYFQHADKLTQPADLATRQICGTVISQLEAWKGAYDPLLQRSKDLPNNRLRPTYLVPRIQSLSFGLAARQVYFRAVPAPIHILTEAAQEILELCSMIIATPDFYRGFVFECEIVPSLFTVCMSCPSLTLRQQALQILRSVIPRHENGWDSVSLVRIAEGALEAELGVHETQEGAIS